MIPQNRPGGRTAPRLLLAAGALLVSGALLAGCTGTPSSPGSSPSAAAPPSATSPLSPPEAETMTPDESQAGLVDLFTRTIASVGGTWEPGMTSSQSACTTADGQDGVQSQPVALGSGFDSPRASAQAVADLWTAEGFAVTTTEVSPGEFEVTRAPAADGLSFRFGVTSVGSDLSGTSICTVE